MCGEFIQYFTIIKLYTYKFNNYLNFFKIKNYSTIINKSKKYIKRNNSLKQKIKKIKNVNINILLFIIIIIFCSIVIYLFFIFIF